MQDEAPVQRESFAIPDDEIDIRLIQRQIANALGAAANGGKQTPAPAKTSTEEDENSGVTLEHSQKTEEASPVSNPTPPPLLKEDSGAQKRKVKRSHEDSIDINELMNDSANNNVSLDLLEQLTSKIMSETGVGAPEPKPEPQPVEEVQEEVPAPTGTWGDISNELDSWDYSEEDEYESEESMINALIEQEESQKAGDMGNEGEKTIVTEQISEYPFNSVDAEYIEALNYLEGDKRYKKFVIYIDEQNLEYLSSLSIKERKDLINNVLHEQDSIRKARLEEERRKKLVTHLLLGIITFFIFMPMLFILLNKCLEATIANYQRSQSNFEILYKERGKIKK